MDDWKLSAVTVVKLEKELNMLGSLFMLILGTTEYRAKKWQKSRQKFAKVVNYTVKSRHQWSSQNMGAKPHTTFSIDFTSFTFTVPTKSTIRVATESCNIKIMIITLQSWNKHSHAVCRVSQ